MKVSRGFPWRAHLVPPPRTRQDTAEYGLGMALGSQQRRERLVEDVKELLEEVPRERKHLFPLMNGVITTINGLEMGFLTTINGLEMGL